MYLLSKSLVSLHIDFQRNQLKTRLEIRGILFKSINSSNRSFVTKYEQAMDQFSFYLASGEGLDLYFRLRASTIARGSPVYKADHSAAFFTSIPTQLNWRSSLIDW